MKICAKVVKIGKGIKYIFNEIDTDGSGLIDSEEFFRGLKNVFGIYYGRKESEILFNYL